MSGTEDLARAIHEVFISPNVPDANLEPANIVDTTQRIGSAIYQLAAAVAELAEQNRRQADALHNLCAAFHFSEE